MSISRSSTRIWLAKMSPIATKRRSILAPVHPPNLLQTLPCVPSKRSKYACKQPYHHLQVAHLAESQPSLERRAQLGKDKPVYLKKKRNLMLMDIQSVQRSLSSMGQANPLHNDEIRFIRDHCRGYLQLHAPQKIRVW